MTIPDDFVRRMREVHGAADGDSWLARLPVLLKDCATRWELALDPAFVPLSYNYVAPAVRNSDGAAVVLKVGCSHPELRLERDALRVYDGRGCVRLLADDEQQGALLLQRVLPGTMLASLFPVRDTEATTIAASVMRQLWRPAPAQHTFPSIMDWAGGLSGLRARFDGGVGPLPPALVEEAERLFPDLISSSSEPPVVLHGDLHHFNILAGENGAWLAIDPKGLVGEPAYETGALLRNPWGFAARPDARQITARRVYQLAEELGIDRARIRGWGLAQAVLSAWWSLEDEGSGWKESMLCAEHIAAVAV